MSTTKIAIITDTACDIPDNLIEKYSIFLVPLRVHFSDGDYRDRIDIDFKTFYDKLESETPKTACPLNSDIFKILNEVKSQGYTEALYISISSALSGAYNAARLAIEGYEGLKIKLIDTKTLSMAQGMCVIEAARELERSNDLNKAAQRSIDVRLNVSALFAVRTLEYLRKGGRIGRLEATLGTLLNIHPIITCLLEDGQFHSVAKARGFKKTVDKIISETCARFKSCPINVTIIHTCVLDEAEALLEKIKPLLNIKESLIAQLGPAMGTHVGKGLLGIIAHES